MNENGAREDAAGCADVHGAEGRRWRTKYILVLAARHRSLLPGHGVDVDASGAPKRRDETGVCD